MATNSRRGGDAAAGARHWLKNHCGEFGTKFPDLLARRLHIIVAPVGPIERHIHAVAICAEADDAAVVRALKAQQLLTARNGTRR